MKIDIKSSDKLKRELDELQKAITALDGHLATLRFNPHDPQDVQRAIREMEQAVDVKTAKYRNNPIVQKIVARAKQHFRERLLRDSAKARNTPST